MKTLSRNLSDLYDPKGSTKSVHRDLNTLRVKLALSKDSSLVKLPPSEAAFRQHILRVAFQVYVWTQNLSAVVKEMKNVETSRHTNCR